MTNPDNNDSEYIFEYDPGDFVVESLVDREAYENSESYKYGQKIARILNRRLLRDMGYLPPRDAGK